MKVQNSMFESQTTNIWTTISVRLTFILLQALIQANTFNFSIRFCRDNDQIRKSWSHNITVRFYSWKVSLTLNNRLLKLGILKRVHFVIYTRDVPLASYIFFSLTPLFQSYVHFVALNLQAFDLICVTYFTIWRKY